MTEPGTITIGKGVWSRAHQNGLVSTVWLSPAMEMYCVGVMARTCFITYEAVVDFEDAKISADRASDCPQPCGCPPWK